ncbi:hypothetical protein OLMES_0481 [Oleiphilus messinensis]|uniref:Uncharacterized protein n=1 Tax=Oleiphilus messinensis TaxID=141451 RepID=A0A1Y0I4X1_9GAMM|nr:hypothetical protein OLMES_0481 [Oleiphilus messinensis]
MKKIVGGVRRLALLSNGQLAGWGDNVVGNSQLTRLSPVLAPKILPIPFSINDIFLETFHGCLLDQNNRLFKWKVHKHWFFDNTCDDYYLEPVSFENGEQVTISQ